MHGEAQAPYGGTKASGFGRFDGRAFIDEFTELKWVTIEKSGNRIPSNGPNFRLLVRGREDLYLASRWCSHRP